MIRALWEGDDATYRGAHFDVPHARLYTAPGEEIPLVLAAGKPEDEARRIARERWPNAALPGDLSQELERPEHFEQAAQLVREEDVAGTVVCGPDPEPYRRTIADYAAAGLDNVHIHQIGTDQEGFVRFAGRELLSRDAAASAA